ncbi:MAG: hypothetical protein V4486_03385 [Patescibacteria group bacterium]
MQYRIKKSVWVVLLIIIIGAGAFYFFFGGSSLFSPQNENSYQAVFLTNGQAYFGKLSTSGSWIVLKDVYYLEAKDALQPEGVVTDAKSPVPVANPQQKIQLVQLGGELHGPEGQMFIEKDKVLFWENMKSDSKVLEAIKQYKGGSL